MNLRPSCQGGTARPWSRSRSSRALAALPIETWNYQLPERGDPPHQRTAQDLATAFGVDEDDRHINSSTRMASRWQ